MNNGEFYSSNEYNRTLEHKHFPAEAYVKLKEENVSGKEIAGLGQETTTLQKKQRTKKSEDGRKTLIDKMFGSIRGVATAATVAAASVVATTTLSTGTPSAELIDVRCGDTYVEYRIEISGLEEDDKYAIVLSTTNEEDVELELDGDGTYENRIDGLKPEWEYTLSFVRYDEILGEIRHFETKFQTLKHSEQDPMPPPDPIPDPTPDPTPDPAPTPTPDPIPNITVTGASIVGLNEIRIDFSHADISASDSVKLDVLFGDMSEKSIVLSKEDVERGYLTTKMDTSDTLTVTPKIYNNTSGSEKLCGSYSHTFDETLSVKAMVGLYAVTFYPVGLSKGGEYLYVSSSEAPETYDLFHLRDLAQAFYSLSGEITYTLYFTNDQKDILSNEVKVTVDTSTSFTEPEYNFSYLNPNDVGITYNDDGTINVYIQTQFASENDEVYYKISLGNIVYTSREPIARIEGIPDTNYTLHYDVCMNVDGVEYSIFHVSPSGTVNEAYVPHSSECADDTHLTLRLYKNRYNADLSSVVLVSSSGEEIILTEADFVYNSEYDTYDAAVEFELPFTEVVIKASMSVFHTGLEGVDDYAGSVRKTFEITVYAP